MTEELTRYKRVAVHDGKHGPGDFRVTLNGTAPTHGEILALLCWVFMAEDRYPKFGRRMLWWHIQRVYHRDAPLQDILNDVDGTGAQRDIT